MKRFSYVLDVLKVRSELNMDMVQTKTKRNAYAMRRAFSWFLSVLAGITLCAALSGCLAGLRSGSSKTVSEGGYSAITEPGGEEYVSEVGYRKEPEYESQAPTSEASEEGISSEQESAAESLLEILPESIPQAPPPVSVEPPKASSTARSGATENPPASSSAPVSEPPIQNSSIYLSDIELEVIGCINAERSANGLGELAYDASLAKAARIRSAEMFAGDFFKHTRKNGEGWETVLKYEVPLTYKSAGENLAMIEHNLPGNDPAYDAAYWYEVWEDSPKHYANMVRPEFTHVGVGIYYGTRDGLKTAIATTIFMS